MTTKDYHICNIDNLMDNFTWMKISTQVKLTPHGLSGVLITFSGVDGSGKSTIIERVHTYLRSRDVNCVVIKTPSQACRELDYFRTYAEDYTTALHGKIDLPSLCLVCLGDRLMTIRTRILPLLKQGIWVLCDRYLYTALAELLAVGCSRKDMESVMVVASLFPAPDLAILTDVSANEAIRRIRQRPAEWNARINRMLFGRIVQAFRRVGEENGLVLVSTENTPEEVFETFRPRLDDLINDWEDKLLNTGETGRWGTDR